ncbi:hypothetical protein MTO96_030551 [Rhipicephalus appendiculatus]
MCMQDAAVKKLPVLFILRERKRKLRAQERETEEPFWEYVGVTVCIIVVATILVWFAVIIILKNIKHMRSHWMSPNKTVSPRLHSPPSL